MSNNKKAAVKDFLTGDRAQEDIQKQDRPKRSVISRLVVGYGIFLLTILLLVITSVVYIAVHRIGRSERLIVDSLILQVERLSRQALLPDPDFEKNFVSPHREFFRQIEKINFLPGRFFLPERFPERFVQIQRSILTDFQSEFKSFINTVKGNPEALRSYLAQNLNQLELLNDYRVDADIYRNQLLNMIIIIFIFFALLGAGTAAVYFFYYLPDIDRALRKTLQLGRNISAGDLEDAPALPRDRNDEIGDLFRLLKEMLITRRTMNRVQELSAGPIKNCDRIEEIVAGIYDSVSKQAELLENTSTSFNEIAATIKSLYDHASNNYKTAKESEAEIGQSTQTILRGVEDVHLLEKQTVRIEEITELIGDIADQTDLLALNAAIEAARAGEFGKGFNVVALEVQKLADKSAKAASEIAELVGSVMDVVKRIAQRSADSNQAMSSIQSRVSRVARDIHEVARTSESASESIDRVNLSIDSIMNLTMENLSNADEIVAAYRALKEDMDNLKNALGSAKQAAWKAPRPGSPDKKELPAATASYAITTVQEKQRSGRGAEIPSAPADTASSAEEQKEFKHSSELESVD
ncbi:hypothetical protein ES703_67039 [subsurface metagenome]